MTDEGVISLRVTLRVSTFKRLREVGDEHGVDAGVVLSQLADRAVRPKPARKRRVSLGPVEVEKAAELRALGRSFREIAAELGTSHTTVRKALDRAKAAA